MSKTEYPEILVVESDVPCPVLERTPRLPVRIHVLDARTEASPAVSIADDLAQLARDLGAADGVVVQGSRSSGWITRLPTGSGRWDGLVVYPPTLLAASSGAGELDSSVPDESAVTSLTALLSNTGARFLILAPSPATSEGVGPRAVELARRVKLVRALAAAGAPAVVLLPVEWPDDITANFVARLFERLLHDSSLERAVSRAAQGRFELPSIFQPRGSRGGLDLGRLLEHQRKRISELSSLMKRFARELEAASDVLGPEVLLQRLERVERRVESLEGARTACEEINRDRDPAGWSRLAQSVELLNVLSEDDRADRLLLARQLASMQSQESA